MKYSRVFEPFLERNLQKRGLAGFKILFGSDNRSRNGTQDDLLGAEKLVQPRIKF